MRRFLKLVVFSLALACIAAMSMAVVIQAIDFQTRWEKGGVLVSKTGVNPSTNVITTALSGSATKVYDFANIDGGCEDSTAITVTGAVAGDTCTVGTLAPVQTALGSFTCYVSAADAVKVRFCNPDTVLGADPVDGGYLVRTFSNQ